VVGVVLAAVAPTAADLAEVAGPMPGDSAGAVVPMAEGSRAAVAPEASAEAHLQACAVQACVVVRPEVQAHRTPGLRIATAARAIHLLAFIPSAVAKVGDQRARVRDPAANDLRAVPRADLVRRWLPIVLPLPTANGILLARPAARAARWERTLQRLHP
jgi:hypothetical protein